MQGWHKLSSLASIRRRLDFKSHANFVCTYVAVIVYYGSTSQISIMNLS